MNNYHTPVLLEEAVSSLNIIPGKKYIDATLGGGGHTEEILHRGGIVLGIDCDIDAIKFARKRLVAFLNNHAGPSCDETCPHELLSKQACPGPVKNGTSFPKKLGAFSHYQSGKLLLSKGNFSNLLSIANKSKFSKVDGILFDLGASSHQLLEQKRGFSFNKDAVLDMRMDQDLKVKAVDLVNVLNKGELYELFKIYGEEHHSRAIADNIVRTRSIKPINSTNELAKIVLKSVPKKGKFDRTHPATRVFQALRIAVNDELNNLKNALPQAIELLTKGGRLVIISFHSLEDRIVKQYFKDKDKKGVIEILTKHPIRPKLEEIKNNPRSRSAKMRVAEKINNEKNS